MRSLLILSILFLSSCGLSEAAQHAEAFPGYLAEDAKASRRLEGLKKKMEDLLRKKEGLEAKEISLQEELDQAEMLLILDRVKSMKSYILKLKKEQDPKKVKAFYRDYLEGRESRQLFQDERLTLDAIIKRGHRLSEPAKNLLGSILQLVTMLSEFKTAIERADV